MVTQINNTVTRLIQSWWRFVGTFRDWRADCVELQITLLAYHVAVACETPEVIEKERQTAIKTIHRLCRYHGWVSSIDNHY